MNLSKSLEIADDSGTMLHVELLWLAEQASTHPLIAEIGSWTGASTRAMADNTSGTVYAIDTWEGTDWGTYVHILGNKPKEWLFECFTKNMANLPLYRVVPIRMLSLEGAEYLKNTVQFDMIFIDASHDYENVKADILAWRPLLKKGGLLCGHDYTDVFPGVVQAVNELISSPVNVAGRIWCA